MKKFARVKCNECDRVVWLDVERAMVNFHFDGRLGPCPGVYTYRALTKREAFWDGISNVIDWRAFFIMFISGGPILIFNQLAFGFKPKMVAWAVWAGWLILLFFIAYIFRRIRR